MNYRTIMKWPLLMFCLLSFGLGAEQVYRSVDKDGNVTFSDTASENAEAIEVTPANIQNFPAPPAAPRRAAPEPEQNLGYSLVRITSPENEANIWNEPVTTIRASLTPRLHEGHQVQFLSNGNVLGAPSRGTSISVEYMDRGTHELQVQVLDHNGKVITTSEPVTLYIHRTTVRQRPN